MKRNSPPKPGKADLIPAGLLDAPPDDARLALGWIQGNAAQLASQYAATIRRRAEVAARPYSDDALKLEHRVYDQDAGRYRVLIPRLFNAVLRWIPDWAGVDFQRHCESADAAQRDLDAATAQWERLNLEARKRIHATAEPAATQVKGEGGDKADKAGKVKRRHRQRQATKTLTAKQIEAVKVFGDCEANMVRTANKLGISRGAARDRVEAAYRKLGAQVPKTVAKTAPLSRNDWGATNLAAGEMPEPQGDGKGGGAYDRRWG